MNGENEHHSFNKLTTGLRVKTFAVLHSVLPNLIQNPSAFGLALGLLQHVIEVVKETTPKASPRGKLMVKLGLFSHPSQPKASPLAKPVKKL